MSLSNINLPFPVIVHAGGLTGLGLYLTFFRHGPANIFAPRGGSPRASDTTSMFGVAVTALGLCYLMSSYAPVEQNPLLYASVPLRLGMSGVLLLAMAVNGRHMTKQGFWEHAAMAAWDGLGALHLGWYLGAWDGMCPALR